MGDMQQIMLSKTVNMEENAIDCVLGDRVQFISNAPFSGLREGFQTTVLNDG
jgi:hypothetical protein